MTRIFTPGILPSSPVEYCVRTRNRFLASCWVMVLAPRARPLAMSLPLQKVLENLCHGGGKTFVFSIDEGLDDNGRDILVLDRRTVFAEKNDR